MTTATARADLSVIKARQQKTWASGGRPPRPAGYSAPTPTARTPCGNHFAPETTMNRLYPRENGSGGHAGTRSGITRQDLMRKARRTDVITPGDPGYDGAPQSLSQRC